MEKEILNSMDNKNISIQELRAGEANKVTWIGLVINTLLTLLKLIAGILGSSGAMIADAIHSFSDFATDIVILLGFNIVKKPADQGHRYGHGKVETLMTVIIGLSLAYVGLRIFWVGTNNIYNAFGGKVLRQPGWIAFFAAIVSIASKEWLYRFTLKTGKLIKSPAVIANAWHHRSDAFSSIGTMLGIGGAIVLGEKWRLLDPLAAIIVSVFIMKVAYNISKAGVNELLESSLGEEMEKEIKSLIESIPGITNAHNMKTRRIGSAIAIDIHIRVDRSLNIIEAHDITTLAEEKIRQTFGSDTVVYVHTEPR